MNFFSSGVEILDESPDIKQLNEMYINVQDHLPNEVELSIYYPKLRTMLHSEIIRFCKEQLELKADLNMLRMMIGNTMTEKSIREYLDGLKEKYNSQPNNNIGIDYHIETTRIDFGVALFCVIKRNNISMKKFVFRFRKENITTDLDGLSVTRLPLSPETSPLRVLTGKKNGGE